MIVVDASVVVEIVLRGPEAARLEQRLRDDADALHVPHLIDLEVAQAVRRHVLQKRATVQRGHAAIADLQDFPAERHRHNVFLPRIWALRDNITPYDAAYVALAEWLDVPLLTRDARLANAGGHAARIEVV